MGKKKAPPSESYLILPTPPSSLPIVDTHTHLASTFEFYRSKYHEGTYDTLYEFAKGVYEGKNVEAIVDVWCEAPVRKVWKEMADSAIGPAKKEKWKDIEYWFVMGVHPHEAKHYNDEVEADIIEAMAHPRCVGWGEMGLDYHYDNSPRDLQQAVFARQLRHAVRLGKPLTIHTREADIDTERILKEEVPKDHKIHIHCFTDSTDFAQRLMDHFPNLYIGITGVITYTTNTDTSTTVRNMITPSSTSQPSPKNLRILLETDAPYMVPSNLYSSLPATLKGKLPICHTAMIPWTADFVANIAKEATGEGNAVAEQEGGVGVDPRATDDNKSGWDADRVMKEARANARFVYGV